MSLPPIHRVVTDHGANGQAVVASNGPLPTVPEITALPGSIFHEVWCTTGAPAPVHNGPDPSLGPLMASIAGLRGNKAIGLYRLSKAALAQLARNLAVEWGPHGVRVNAVSPGLICTPLAAGLLDNEVFMERGLQATPLRRVGEPEEVRGAVVFLASRAGRFVTGHNLVVDGGTLVSDGS